MNQPKTITILGVGGFVGSHLLERLLKTTSHTVYGIDIASAKIDHLRSHPHFSFILCNVHDTQTVRKFVEKADIVISLVALCNPSLYNTIPLDVIDINFLRPLELVKTCAELGTWLIHYSTSEVYGKTPGALHADPGDAPESYLLSEDTSQLIMGPIRAQRWSYACAKQLLERTIFAYGFEKNLDYTIIRPFNFIGPHMDYIPGVDGDGTPRVIACFMEALMRCKPLRLVDGGINRRCFTYIDDAIDAQMAVLSRPEQAKKNIFNVGNPHNEISITELASKMIEIYKRLRPEYAETEFEKKVVSSKKFYGEGYEDSDRRVPDNSKIYSCLGWTPSTDLDTALYRTIDAYIEEYAELCECRKAG